MRKVFTFIAALTLCVGLWAEKTARELLGEMGDPCVGCHAVEVKKGDHTVTLYAPDKVKYVRIEN